MVSGATRIHILPTIDPYRRETNTDDLGNWLYPVFIKELEDEACEEAIICCVYSWKSHQQHEKKVQQI